jgi:hypothetical protein
VTLVAVDPHTMAAGALSQNGIRRKLLILLAWGKLNRCRTGSRALALDRDQIQVLDQIDDWAATFPTWAPKDLVLAGSSALFDETERRVALGQQGTPILAGTIHRIRLDPLCATPVDAPRTGDPNDSLELLLRTAFLAGADIVVTEASKALLAGAQESLITDHASGNKVTAMTPERFIAAHAPSTTAQLERLAAALLADACELCELVDYYWPRR